MADNDNGNLTWIYRFEQPQQCCNRCIEGTHRYVIGALKKYPPTRDQVLICIGLNPNDGIPGRLEKTVQAINDFAFYNEIKPEEREKIKPWPSDGWIMLNLSPIRRPDPDQLPTTLEKMNLTAHNENIKIIKSILEKYPDAVRLAAWGDEITKEDKITKKVKDYLRETFNKSIIKEREKDRKWYCCCLQSEAVLTEKGNPRHPSRSWGMSPKKAVLHEFKIIDYEP